MKKPHLKFNEVAERFKLALLEEADESGLPPDAALPAPSDGGAIPPAPVQDAPPAAPIQPLSDEGEVTLIRLLKKAFIAKPSDLDAAAISAMGETTSENAKSQLGQLTQMVGKYTNTEAA